MWDVVYMAVFYFVPVFLFDVKVDKWGIIGMITMVIGILVMKIGHHSG
jgi:multidrug transporter EmrE-like cation transporter